MRLTLAVLLGAVLPGLTQVAEARPTRPGNEIIGGQPAGPGEFPFMAALLNQTISGTDFDRHFCGGSLIAPQWVLTAAHCVEEVTSPSQLAVAVGRTVLSNGTQGERRGVSDVYVHPDYNDPVALAHDAALLRLSSPVTATPIALVLPGNEGFEAAGRWLTTIGWGTTKAGKPSYPDELRKVDVPVVSDATCSRSYGTSLHAPTMVCAGAEGIDSCQGDSGGPLFGTEPSGSRSLVGIVSWGRGCAKKRFPGVYSEVNNPAIYGWVKTTAGI